MRSCQFLIFCALLSLITVANAQTPAPADVHVKLVLADKKNLFRVGEQIRLNMEISADREGYRVETLPDGGTVGNDVVVVAPETGITHWLDELQDWLLREHAKLLDDPALLPSLKKILSASDSTSKSTRGTVLRRLMELAPDEARPYVIAEIRDVNSRVDPAILIGLQDESLPELDATLLDQIRALSSLSQNTDFVYLKFKTRLLVRFATNNIYGDVMELYRRVGKRLPVDSRACLLAYFAKHNDEEAVPLIEQALSDVKPGQAPMLLRELTALYYSASVGTVLKKLLDSDDVLQAADAAYLIGHHGLPGDEQVLEARLKRWREQWRDRLAEADAQRQGLIERGLVTALMTGKSWKLSDIRANELRASCLTQLCKESNPTH